LTIPSTVSLFSPTSRAAAKASSRLGPTCAEVPACARAWQVPHFCTKRVRPRAVSAVVVPHPVTATSIAPRAARSSSGRMSFRCIGRGISAEAGRSLYVGPTRKRPVARGHSS